MAKKGKGKSKKVGKSAERLDESSDDEVVMKKSSGNKMLSDSEDELDVKRVQKRKVKRPAEIEDDPKHKVAENNKRKFIRCVDSSDEEDAKVFEKADRIKKLEEMRNKIKGKRTKVSYSSSEDSNEGPDDDDDEDLPMWENEEVLPEGAELDKNEPDHDQDDLNEFVVDDDVEEGDLEAVRLPDSDDDDVVENKRRKVKANKANTSEKESEAEKVKKTRKSTRCQNSKKSESEEEKLTGKNITAKGETSDSDDEDSNDSETEYQNPYMAEDDNEDIMAVLRRDTAQDRKNAKNYRKEVGKYQFAVHNKNNKAALIDSRTRFARNMSTAKFDQGLKEDRNLDTGDSEYYDYKEVTAYGEAIRIFPHTMRITRYNGRCSLSGCKDVFVAGETNIVGATKLCPFSARFVKKDGPFGKPSFYYVCAEHLPKEESDDENVYPSDSNSDSD